MEKRTQTTNQDLSPARDDEVNARRRPAELAKLLPLWPKELEDRSLPGRRKLLRCLERALREERRRGRAGHWAYDLARHHQLAKIWREEWAELKSLEAAENYKPRY